MEEIYGYFIVGGLFDDPPGGKMEEKDEQHH
ncbi:MAG: hypothetical protein AMQ74_00121 [Candidatus Methanofastidiosum methylothiophilum]|jgi:hypothetical protein|uniref:Uncharacterized protein n=1 Tax=Candidatus Methanofastidiosum methylothiophilum TaxID=1705564 RepID=A0A150JAI3_9EURY|nr:MAG: hypothetical protein AMQ74_00121 [Candidatus Methanofastidiosum methylthiophilus]